MSTKIQLRRGLSSEWTTVNPLLASGEIGIETDTKQIKVGDGVTYWNSLAYSFISEASAQDLIDVHANRTDNPHSVTKAQVGLSNVLNLSPANLPISNATQAALDLKYDTSNPSNYVDATGAATAAPVQSVAGKIGAVTLTKSDVGLSDVDNISAANLRDRSTHTGTQLASTISDFTTASQGAVIVQTISNNDTTHSPSSDAVHDALAIEEAARISIGDRVTDIENDYGVANGLATLDSAGKISTSMLPGTVLEYKGIWDASTNTPTLQNGSGANSLADAGHLYRVSVAGSVDFGSGSITFNVGDDVILSEALIWQRAPGGSLVVSVNGYQGDVLLNSEDIQLTTSVASASDVQHALENIYTSVSSTMTDHTEALDPHPQYETSTEVQAKVDTHANRTDNPHSVTKTQLGLSNVDNTSDLNKPISTATQSALDLKYDASNPNNYVNASEAAAAAPVQSVAGKTGVVTLNKSDVGLSSVDNVSAASLRDRSTHTGTQLASTISDFTTAVQGVTIDATQIDGGSVSNAEFVTLDGIDTSQTIQTQISARDVAVLGYNLAGATGHIHNIPLTSIEASGLMAGSLVSVVKNSSLSAGHVHSTTITWNSTNRLFVYSVATASGHVHDVVAQQPNGSEYTVNWLEGQSPSAPTSGLISYSKSVGGRNMFAQIGKSGVDYSFQPFLGRNRALIYQANGNATTSTVWGALAPTATGTATARTVATTNLFAWMKRIGYVTAITNNSVAGLRSAVLQNGLSNVANAGGFHFVTRFGISDAVLVAGARLFVGMVGVTTNLGNADPSSNTNIIGVGLDAADTTLQIMYNGTGTATKINLGASFPESTNTDMYELSLYAAPNSTTVYYGVTNLSTGATASGTITSNLPAVNTLLTYQLWRHNATTGSAVGLDIVSIYLETDN